MARSRDELIEIIKRGESVLMPDGRNITNIDDLPSAIELAGDDIVKKAHAVGDLIAARAALDAQIAEAQKAEAPNPTTPEEKPKPPDAKK